MRENCIQGLVGKPEGKRPLVRHRWEDNIRKDLKEIGWEGMVIIHVAQNRSKWQVTVSTVIKPLCCIKSKEFLDKVMNH
jgi:hypothetical protein